MRERVLRVLLVLLAAPAAAVGGWAVFAPRGFYDDFPGLGGGWVRPDGPYNEHLVRDVDGLYLALVLVTVAAAVTLGPVLVRAAGSAWLLQGALHLAYHARHLAPFSVANGAAMVTSVASVPALAGAVLLLARAEVRRVPQRAAQRRPTLGRLP